MAPRQLSIRAATQAIRDARKLALVGTDPYTWHILSTVGDYKHVLVYEPDREDVVCVTCEAKHGVNRCWARGRVLTWLEAEYGPEKPSEPTVAVVPPEPKVEGQRTWLDAYRESKGEAS